MSKYIDSDKLIERLMHNPDFLIAPKHSKDGIIDEIVYQPTADVVEVVRCKDCMYWIGKDYNGCCVKNGLATRYAKDYCSYGEKERKREI